MGFLCAGYAKMNIQRSSMWRLETVVLPYFWFLDKPWLPRILCKKTENPGITCRRRSAKWKYPKPKGGVRTLGTRRYWIS